MLLSKLKRGLFLNYSMILFCLMLTGVCCNKPTSKKEKFQEKVKQYQGKKVVLPMPDSILYKGQMRNIRKSGIKNNKLKISTYINGKCHSCIEGFSKWQELIDISNKNKNFNIIFYVYTDNKKEFKEYFYPTIIHDFPLVIDKKQQYLKSNEIPEFGKFNTFLLNKNNHIILVGNPIYTDKLMKLYKQEINKRLD